MPRRLASGLLVPVAAFAPLVVFVPACSKEPSPAETPPVSKAADPKPAAAPATPVVAAPPAPTKATATAAYDAKDYTGCAAQFAQVATSGRPAQRADMLYSAACCHALAKNPDKAFAALNDAIAAGFVADGEATKDVDLEALHGDPRWPEALDAMRAKAAEIEKSLTKPALRKELLDMVDQDQKVLLALAAKQKAGEKVDFKSAEPMTKAHTKRLVEIVKADGWPGKSMVGEDGAHAAWLLTQHSDLDLAFQKDVLARMKPMVQSGQVSEVDYAYLEDRVAVAEKRPQRYGTQFDEHREPRPIEDEAHVDERRTAIGMPTMAEYRKMMVKMYGEPKK